MQSIHALFLWLIGIQCICGREAVRILDCLLQEKLGEIFSGSNRSTLLLALLLLMPVFRTRRHSRLLLLVSNIRIPGWVAFAVAGGVSIATFLHVRDFEIAETGLRFHQLGPVIHDEFSYLLQTELFLQGMWYAPGPSVTPQIFHQMHILNEGRFSSRYFPGTAAWIAPFKMVGLEDYANGVSFVFVCLVVTAVGKQIAGNACALVSGLFVAMSPALAVFSNLMLSHLPCLLGIVTFLLAAQKASELPTQTRGFMMGGALGFAALCRPLTAASLGLPYGILLLAQTARATIRRSPDYLMKIKQFVAICASLLAALVLLLVQNYCVCSHPLKSPYTQYTELYTPNHVYGFQNVARGITHITSDTLGQYNSWAKNLTFDAACHNSIIRVISLIKWSIGSETVFLFILFLVPSVMSWPRSIMLLIAAIASLHAAHFPYWFVGILQHHYVIESGALLAILLGYGVQCFIQSQVTQGCRLMPLWTLLFLAVCAIPNYVSLDRHATLISTGLETLSAPALRYRQFQESLQNANIELPALVLINSTEDDLHVEYIRNAPEFGRPLLVAMLRPDVYTIDELKSIHRSRHIYVYHSATRRIEAI